MGKVINNLIMHFSLGAICGAIVTILFKLATFRNPETMIEYILLFIVAYGLYSAILEAKKYVGHEIHINNYIKEEHKTIDHEKTD